jgi:thymidylate synthase (FAD)
MGQYASICYDSEGDPVKIAKHCIKANHGRVLEFADVTFTVVGISAKVVREIFRHKHASELQMSTRYVDYSSFDVEMPPTIAKNEKAREVFQRSVAETTKAIVELRDLGIPREDFSYLLPVAYSTEFVYKINLRSLLGMVEIRTCMSAMHEFRKFMHLLKHEIRQLCPEWETIVDDYMKIKCEKSGYCTEPRIKCGIRPYEEMK